MKPQIYLAGPDVFYPDARARLEALKDACADLGMEGLSPLDGLVDPGLSRLEQGRSIYAENVRLLARCDAVCANLTPFRGPSADVGTVWECGNAHGQGKPVVGYRPNVTHSYVTAVVGKMPHDGMMVENFDVCDNIMVAHGCKTILPDYHQALTALAQILGVT